ncbi:RibD family protein [Rhizobium sp. SSA_523]|uniref:RibD family protein n=1 Tax=Rhizobium sp. SSA_523 TaxID=2952477 RepID=UPI002091DF57|nr:RibD family protein [Rhizobium sp. SSA_523]MCO5732486.1 RibD family protein [Rhizobium sp. SSA_523]WKC22373.1 RibD family protein [Rhizobium sp. SSA_523]
MTDTIWTRLLEIRDRTREDLGRSSDPAFALYGPIAAARGRFVLAQVGQSLDGRVATPFGDAQDISGPEGIAHLHRCRALVDAVIVGVGTVKADNPRLSVRAVRGRDPVRVVIDCHAQLAGDEGLFHDGGAPVIVIQSDEAPRRSYPAKVIRLPLGESGICPEDILDALDDCKLKRILVEGGARTISRFIDMGLVDHLHVAIAPLIIGSGPQGISLPPIRKLSEAHRPEAEVFSLGSDILFDCRLREEPMMSLGRQSQKVQVTDKAAAALVDVG